MKKFFIALLTLGLLQLQCFAASIPAGTSVVVQSKNTIDADYVKIGDKVNFKVARPVKVNGENVIPVGTEVSAVVVKKKNNGILGIPGKIEIGQFELDNPNGSICLTGNVYDEGENRYWANVGWIFVFPLLFIKGNDGKINPTFTYTLYTVEESSL